ncbi:MAG: DNA polymerase III subunit beta [Novosphingobium sp.]
MNLYVERDLLMRGLAKVQGAVSTKSTHPMAAAVLLRAEGDRIVLSATDTEAALVSEVEANVHTPGAFAVAHSGFASIIRSLPDPTARILVKDQKMVIESGKSKYKVSGYSADDFLPMPSFEIAEGFSVTERDLLRMVDLAGYAVSTYDVRLGLNGLHLEMSGPLLRAVGTDGHRLAMCSVPIEGALNIQSDSLVPRRALAVLRKLLGEASMDLVRISFATGAMLVEIDGVLAWFRLVNGQFPDYGSIIPTPGLPNAMHVPRAELVAALKRIEAVHDPLRPMVIRISDSAIEAITSSHATGKELSEEISISHREGKADEIGFSPALLAESVGKVSETTVLIEFANALAPVRVVGLGGEGSDCIVMPMQMA